MKRLFLLFLLLSFIIVLVRGIEVKSKPVGFWNIPDPTSYEYGPSIILENGVFYSFYCSPGANGAWDFIRMTTSGDGLNWSEPAEVLAPSDTYDTESVCDPSVVKFHGVYFLYHTCISDNAPDGYKNNRICVAMSDSITGPYQKLGYPVVEDKTCSPTDTSIYCVGQPSAVVFNDLIYLFFTEMNNASMPGPNAGYIFLATSGDGVNFTWANEKKPVFLQRDVDVKYERSSKYLFMVQGDVGDSHISWSVSSDGIDWMPYNLSNTIATNPQLPAKGTNNNPGIAGLPDGSFDGMTFVSYGSSYQAGWGTWHLYRTDITVNPSNNDCNGCASISCDFQCSRLKKTTYEGYCDVPGSTDPAKCCTCDPYPVQADCSGCSQGCVAACNNLGHQTGVCAVPGSTNPRVCCACFD